MKHFGMLAFAPTLAFAGPLGVFPHAPAVAQSAAKPQLAAVSAHLTAMKTMTADFSQTGQNGQTLTGKLTLPRLGIIRCQYQPGVPLLVVTYGRTLPTVVYQLDQASAWPARTSPLGGLLDPHDGPGRSDKSKTRKGD